MRYSTVLKKLSSLTFITTITAFAFIPLIASCSENKQVVVDETTNPAAATDTQTATAILLDNDAEDKNAINGVKKTETTSTDTPCDQSVLSDGDLPIMVLAGTDVFEKSTFDPGEFSEGRFSAEVGGANISITLTSTAKGLAKLHRKYAEPGLGVEEKTYNNLCVENNRVYNASILLDFVSDGVLLWEGNSGNEFISSDLFMYLKGVN